MVEFLRRRFDAGSTYSQLNNFRSAISSTVAPFAGQPVGQNRLVVQIMRSFMNARPPKARYQDCWDVDKALSYLETLPDYDTLSPALLRQKTAFLLAVHTIARGDDLFKLRHSSVSFDNADRVTLILSNPKNRRGEEVITLHPWPQRPKLCVVQALRNYLQLTKQVPRPHDRIFVTEDLSTELGKERLAKDILAVMAAAGIDTQRFKAHSVRMAVATKAIQLGMPVDEVMRKGRWRSWQVLRDFYERSRDSGNLVAFLATSTTE